MRAIGIILAGGSSYRMKVLAQNRAVSAMPVAGSYRAIDFALSNMSNSGIQSVLVMTQYNGRSLNEHLSSSKWWDFGRKQGGLKVLTPVITADNPNWYRGTADAMYQAMWDLKQSHEPYVIIASGDCVYKMDYNKVLDYHIKKKAEITVVCKEMPEDANLERYGVIRMDDDHRITEFVEKPVAQSGKQISCGIYVLRRRLLIELLEQCAEEGRYDFVRDVLVRYKDTKKIYGYKFNEYWSNIASVQDYYDTNMDFLKKDMRDYFFKTYPDIYTKVEDMAPAKFNAGSKVKNSLIASGCIVNGNVENSVIFKKVYVGNNVTIKNSIILNDVYIGDNTYIENCIVESRDTIRANTTLIGEPGEIKLVMNDNDSHV
ncbi:MAG: glucose-1-phosphate adenylyltransferase subunit GlgD [Lachnospiraceae bacterium]|nr:glucose-1-phosphate adenylyltransferase subunit GlgD [Lachnospiraceae bacterium]